MGLVENVRTGGAGSRDARRKRRGRKNWLIKQPILRREIARRKREENEAKRRGAEEFMALMEQLATLWSIRHQKCVLVDSRDFTR